MSDSSVPYFLWDYNLTSDQVRSVLTSPNETENIWLRSRILESAIFPDVWKYTTLAELRHWYPKLKLKKPVKRAWDLALHVWQENDSGQILKVDFVKDIPIHFGDIVTKGKIRLDSLENIGSNKVLALFGRTEAKDFVDLYYLITESGLNFDQICQDAKQKDLGFSEFYLANSLDRLSEVVTYPVLSKPLDIQKMNLFYQNLRKHLLLKIKPSE